MSFFEGIKDFWNVSFGVVTIFLYIFLLFNTSQFVPKDQVSFWTLSFIIPYLLMLSLAIGVSDSRSRLFNVKTISFLPRLALYFIPAYVIFGLIFNKISLTAGSILGVFTAIPFWLAFIHVFMVATIESTIQVWAEESTKLRRFGTALCFGALHIFVWTGSAFINFFSATLLFLFFSAINYYFRQNRNDLAPIIGVHAGYNVAQLVNFVA